MTDLGVTGGGKNDHMLYINGNQIKKVNTNEIVNKIISLVEQKDNELKAKSQKQ